MREPELGTASCSARSLGRVEEELEGARCGNNYRKNRFEILGDHKLLLMYRRPHELIIIYSAAPRSISSGWEFPVDFSDVGREVQARSGGELKRCAD